MANTYVAMLVSESIKNFKINFLKNYSSFSSKARNNSNVIKNFLSNMYNLALILIIFINIKNI